jgi:hypothetical protein
MPGNATYHKYRSQGRCARCGDPHRASHVVLCTACLMQQRVRKRAFYWRRGRAQRLARYDAPGPNQVYCCGGVPHPVTLDHETDGTPLLCLPCCGRVFRLTTREVPHGGQTV